MLLEICLVRAYFCVFWVFRVFRIRGLLIGIPQTCFCCDCFRVSCARGLLMMDFFFCVFFLRVRGLPFTTLPLFELQNASHTNSKLTFPQKTGTVVKGLIGGHCRDVSPPPPWYDTKKCGFGRSEGNLMYALRVLGLLSLWRRYGSLSSARICAARQIR